MQIPSTAYKQSSVMTRENSVNNFQYCGTIKGMKCKEMGGDVIVILCGILTEIFLITIQARINQKLSD